MKISGKVTDSTKETLPMASITMVTGSKANKFGVTADLDGKFQLEDDSILPDSVFQITYVGYLPHRLKASELQGATVVLLQDVEQLSGATVYGKPKSTSVQKRKNQFVAHLDKHKFTYAGIAGIAGLLLIVSSIKK